MIHVNNLSKEECKTVVETTVCRPISQFKQYPLTEDQCKVLVNILLSEGNIPVNEEYQNLLNKDMLYQMIHNRFKVYNLKCRLDFELLCYNVFRSPGEVSIMAAYIAYWTRNYNITRELTHVDWCNIFMMGYYSSEDLGKVWDAQKVNPDEVGGMMDNALDYSEFNESIILPA